MATDGSTEILPNVINVQFGMKIIESYHNYNISDSNGKKVINWKQKLHVLNNYSKDKNNESKKPTMDDERFTAGYHEKMRNMPNSKQ